MTDVAAKLITVDWLARRNLERKVEQLSVQLAGCSVAAYGWNKGECKRGDWGWSQAFEDVQILYAKWDSLRKEFEQLYDRLGRQKVAD